MKQAIMSFITSEKFELFKFALFVIILSVILINKKRFLGDNNEAKKE